MANNPTYKVQVIQTGEVIECYKLSNGNYFDYNNMGADKPATSSTGKKEFSESEVKIIETVKQS